MVDQPGQNHSNETYGHFGGPYGTGNVPVTRSGAWHTVPPYGAFSSTNVPDGRLFFVPMWPSHRSVMTGVAVNVTLALVGGAVRLGLYGSANGLPSRVLQDFGTVPSGVLGMQSITGLKVRVEAGLHYLGVCRQGGALNLGLSSRDTWDPIVSETTPMLAANGSAYYVDGVTGAFEDVNGVVEGTAQGPSASVQLV